MTCKICKQESSMTVGDAGDETCLDCIMDRSAKLEAVLDAARQAAALYGSPTVHDNDFVEAMLGLSNVIRAVDAPKLIAHAMQEKADAFCSNEEERINRIDREERQFRG